MIISAPWGDTEFPDGMPPEQALGVLDNHYMQQQQSQLPPVAQTLSSMFGGFTPEPSIPALPSNASLAGMRGDDIRALVDQSQQRRAQVSQNSAQERMRQRIATEKALEAEKDRAAQLKLEEQRLKNQMAVEKMRIEREENDKQVLGSSTTGYYRVGKTGAPEQVIPPQPNLTLIDTVDAQGRHVQQWVPEEQGASYPAYDRPLASGGGGVDTGENLQSVRDILLPGGAVGLLKFYRNGRNELTTLDGQSVNVPPDYQLVQDAAGMLSLVPKQPGVPPTRVPSARPSLRESLLALQSDTETTGFQAGTPKPVMTAKEAWELAELQAESKYPNVDDAQRYQETEKIAAMYRPDIWGAQAQGGAQSGGEAKPETVYANGKTWKLQPDGTYK